MSFFEKLFRKKSEFNFNEPVGWNKTKGFSISFQHPTDELTNITYIQPKKIWKEYKLGDWSKQIEADKDSCKRYKIISQNIFNIAGLDASDLICEYNVDGDTFKTRSIVILKEGMYVLFYLNTTPKGFLNNNRVMDKLLKTSKWEG